MCTNAQNNRPGLMPTIKVTEDSSIDDEFLAWVLEKRYQTPKPTERHPMGKLQGWNPTFSHIENIIPYFISYFLHHISTTLSYTLFPSYHHTWSFLERKTSLSFQIMLYLDLAIPTPPWQQPKETLSSIQGSPQPQSAMASISLTGPLPTHGWVW